MRITQAVLTPNEQRLLNLMADAILPADDRDAGGAPSLRHLGDRLHSPLYRDGLNRVAAILARPLETIAPSEIQAVLEQLRQAGDPFYRQFRMDLSAEYLSDPEVWRRIGFPGPSVLSGGYPDFDQPQTQIHANLKEPDAPPA
jgi:hypothetical protein